MTRSLQELIDFILNEVALSGNQGMYSSYSPTHLIPQDAYNRYRISWDRH